MSDPGHNQKEEKQHDDGSRKGKDSYVLLGHLQSACNENAPKVSIDHPADIHYQHDAKSY